MKRTQLNIAMHQEDKEAILLRAKRNGKTVRDLVVEAVLKRPALKPTSEADALRAALQEIASRPTVERNPDGEDQAAHTMQMIAKEALGDA